MNKTPTQTRNRQYIIIVTGVLFALLGLFITTRTIDIADISLWLPAILLIAGVVLLSGSATKSASAPGKPGASNSNAEMLVALTLLFIGAFILLRKADIITGAWLQYIIGFGLMGFGVYGLISGFRRLSLASDEPSE